MPEPLTSSAHVMLYERLCGERSALAGAIAAEAKRKPEAVASEAVLAGLNRIIHGARRITARMPGGVRLPFRPVSGVTNTEALVLASQAGAALQAFEDCFAIWDEDAGEEDDKAPTGDFVWNTIDG